MVRAEVCGSVPSSVLCISRAKTNPVPSNMPADSKRYDGPRIQH